MLIVCFADASRRRGTSRKTDSRRSDTRHSPDTQCNDQLPSNAPFPSQDLGTMDRKMFMADLHDPAWVPITANRFVPEFSLTLDDITHFFIAANYETMPLKGTYNWCGVLVLLFVYVYLSDSDLP